MAAKEFLRKIRKLDRDIDRKIQRLHELKEMSVSTGSFDYSKDRVQASAAADAPYVRMLEQITELDNEISADIDCLVDMKERVEWMMHSFTPKQQAVIRSRYFHSYSWKDIAMLLGCTVRNVYYIHQAALQNMDRKML